MTSTKGYILVEGQGDVEAAHNLVTRLSFEAGLHLPWTNPRRWKNLHQWESARTGGVRAGAEFVRGKPDAASLLILRDEDDDCPKELAPKIGLKLQGLRLPFPCAYVLLHPEFEVLFLPVLDRMTTLGFPHGLKWDRDSWEARRGIKEWLSNQLPKGRSYKPTVSQLPMTQKLDFDALRRADVPSFGSLERAIEFFVSQEDVAGAVYPGAT